MYMIVKRIFFFSVSVLKTCIDYQNALRMHHFDANFSKFSGDPITHPPPFGATRLSEAFGFIAHLCPPAAEVLDPPLNICSTDWRTDGQTGRPDRRTDRHTNGEQTKSTSGKPKSQSIFCTLISVYKGSHFLCQGFPGCNALDGAQIRPILRIRMCWNAYLQKQNNSFLIPFWHNNPKISDVYIR